MPLGALLLVLAAAGCHSLWTLALKNETLRLEVSLGAIAIGALACAPALLFNPLGEVPAAAWGLMLLSGVLETGYVVALTAAYRVGDLSLVYPVARGTAPVLVAPLAVLLLGERLSLPGVLGIALVVAGIFASHLGTGDPSIARAGHRRALALALLTGSLTAGYSLVNKAGVALVPVPLYAFCVFSLDAIFLWLVLWRRAGTAWPPGLAARWASMTGVGILMVGSYLMVLGAMALAPVSYVVAAREVSIVVAALLGAIVFKERHSRRRIAGAGIIFAGLVVLALSR
jgi:drug/metabolite transporter (DMT)-like permease